MRPFLSRTLLAAALVLTAACEATAPAPLDEAGVQADLAAANAAVSSPAVVSLGAMGPHMAGALADAGGAVGAADLGPALIKDPADVLARAELRAQLMDGTSTTASVIPQAALGKTFEYDTELQRYVIGERTGAPANGVRFILYAVDPVTEDIVVPLVETGHADLTRTITQVAIIARLEAYSGTQTPVKVLDYAATVQGTIVAPEILVSGFAKNGTDSLTFSLTSALSLATQTVSIDWRTAVPTRGLTSRVQETVVGGEAPAVTINGQLASGSGNVGIVGTITGASGGTLTVSVNGKTFATITVEGFGDETPTILNAQGQPLTPQQQDMLHDILDWFEDAFDFYEDLLDPVERLLDLDLP